MRYALFAGFDYYPQGGWKDAQCVSENIELLKEHCDEYCYDETWAHIVDIKDWIVMCEGKSAMDGQWVWKDLMENENASP